MKDTNNAFTTHAGSPGIHFQGRAEWGCQVFYTLARNAQGEAAVVNPVKKEMF